MMKIGITGGSGMIGSHLTAFLRGSMPDARLRCLARRPAAHGPDDSVEWVAGDLLSSADCEEFVRGLDVVVHLAQSGSPAISDRHWPSDCTANFFTTLNLLNALRESGGRCHFVFASSGGAVYGNAGEAETFSENTPCLPLSPYGIQKLAVEQYLRLACVQGWLTANLLRISNAYGAPLAPERRQGLIGVAVSRHAAGLPIEVFGPVQTTRDFVHLDDLVEAIRLAIVRPSHCQVYNIGSGKGHSVKDILNILEQVSGTPVATVTSAFGKKQFELTPRVVLNCEKAGRELGWQAQVPLRSGIAAMWAQARRNLST